MLKYFLNIINNTFATSHFGIFLLKPDSLSTAAEEKKRIKQASFRDPHIRPNRSRDSRSLCEPEAINLAQWIKTETTSSCSFCFGIVARFQSPILDVIIFYLVFEFYADVVI